VDDRVRCLNELWFHIFGYFAFSLSSGVAPWTRASLLTPPLVHPTPRALSMKNVPINLQPKVVSLRKGSHVFQHLSKIRNVCLAERRFSRYIMYRCLWLE
jgi:hypothetical protein